MGTAQQLIQSVNFKCTNSVFYCFFSTEFSNQWCILPSISPLARALYLSCWLCCNTFSLALTKKNARSCFFLNNILHHWLMMQHLKASLLHTNESRIYTVTIAPVSCVTFFYCSKLKPQFPEGPLHSVIN